MSERDSKSDITTEDEQETNRTQTHQIHNVLNENTHDEQNVSETEDDTSEDENVTEMQTYGNNGEQSKPEELPTLKLKLKTEKLKGS